jgi:hypothetical protein
MADRQSAYSVSLFGSQAGDGVQDATAPSRIQQALVDFIMEFTLDNVFIYRYVHSMRCDMQCAKANGHAETKSARTYWSSNITATLTSPTSSSTMTSSRKT